MAAHGFDLLSNFVAFFPLGPELILMAMLKKVLAVVFSVADLLLRLNTLVDGKSDFCPKKISPIFVLNIVVTLSIHDCALDLLKFVEFAEIVGIC